MAATCIHFRDKPMSKTYGLPMEAGQAPGVSLEDITPRYSLQLIQHGSVVMTMHKLDLQKIFKSQKDLLCVCACWERVLWDWQRLMH